MEDKKKSGGNEFWKSLDKAISVISAVLSIFACAIAIFPLHH